VAFGFRLMLSRGQRSVNIEHHPREAPAGKPVSRSSYNGPVSVPTHKHKAPIAGRQTRQRAAIRDAIAAAGAPVTPKEVLDAASRNLDSLGLATVYRTLKMLVEAGEIATVDIPGEAPRYEIPKGHHHHFHCRGCGKVYELDGCCGHFSELTPKGFRLDGHELLLFGLCKGCAKRA
jgi:Fur family ferric uptake transcriptional regulator